MGLPALTNQPAQAEKAGHATPDTEFHKTRNRTLQGMIRLILSAICVISLPLASCTTTTLTSSWSDTNYGSRPLSKLLVIGIAESVGQRREFEDKFVAQLQAQGRQAIASATLLPLENELSKEAIQRKIEGTDIDGIIVTHLIGTQREQRYNPPTTHIVPVYHGLYGYYHSVYDYVHTPGYYSTHVTVRLETNLYDAETAALVWSAQSETLDPASASEVMDSVIREVVKDLRAKQFI